MNKKMGLFSVGYGIFFWMFGEIVYHFLMPVTGSILGVGIYFTVMALGLMGVLLLLARIDAPTSPNRPKGWKLAVILLCICVGSISLEALYELQIFGKERTIFEKRTPSSVIFALDDSGSMCESDPEDMRIQIIPEVLKRYGNNVPYAVYSFSNGYERIHDIDSDEELTTSLLHSDGETEIFAVLDGILRDLENGELKAKNPRIVLLSDGFPTDIYNVVGDSYDYDSQKEYEEAYYKAVDQVYGTLIEQYQKKGITISTVGLGQADEQMLRELAETTGGDYANASDVSELKEAMVTAGINRTARNLLGDRKKTDVEIIYIILHILFLSLIGLGVSFLKTEACERMTYVKKLFEISIGCCIAGAVLMEVLLTLLGLNGTLIRLLMCILFTLTIIGEGITADSSWGLLEKQ